MSDLLTAIKAEREKVRNNVRQLLAQQVALEKAIEVLSNGHAPEPKQPVTLQMTMNTLPSAPYMTKSLVERRAQTEAARKALAARRATRSRTTITKRHSGLHADIVRALDGLGRPARPRTVAAWLKQNGYREQRRYKTKLADRIGVALVKLKNYRRVERVAHGLYQAVGR